jgi:hypothetical protein
VTEVGKRDTRKRETEERRTKNTGRRTETWEWRTGNAERKTEYGAHGGLFLKASYLYRF